MTPLQQYRHARKMRWIGPDRPAPPPPPPADTDPYRDAPGLTLREIGITLAWTAGISLVIVLVVGWWLSAVRIGG